MNRQVRFITPENIEVEFELAGIASRAVAAIADHALIVLLLLGVALAANAASGGVLGAAVGRWAVAVLILVGFVIVFGYFIFFEWLWAGQSPGKRLLHLRVVRDGGYPVDVYSSTVRNLVRIVDFALAPPYGGGLVAMLASRDYKRMGDSAAGTIVIKERAFEGFGQSQGGALSPLAQQFMPLIRNVDALTGEEFQIIRAFIQRRPQMDPHTQGWVAMRIAAPILPRLGFYIPVPVAWHYAELLAAIERKYVEEQGVL